MRRYGRPLAWVIGTTALLASGTPSVAVASEADSPTFTKDVAPILFETCVTCHRPGEVAPMSLLTYNEARPWARAIKEKVLAREMPPWHADPAGSLKFRNDRSLSQQEIATIVAWVDAGAPKGDDADLPPAPSFASGWQHPSGRAPDIVVPMPVEYEIPADGSIPYVLFSSKMPLPEDVFAEAVEARPDNRTAVHHMTASAALRKEPPSPGPVFAPVNSTSGNRSAEQGRSFEATAASGVTALYTPGQGFEQFPAGFATRIPGGPNSYLSFNMHYQLTGKPEKDRSAVGIWVARGPIQYEMIRSTGTNGTVLAQGAELLSGTPGLKAPLMYAVVPNIPPNTENFKMVIVTPFPEPATIYQFNPHAHLRGKDFTYNLVYPDGREQALLHVPRYDFNWQLIYQLETPLQVPAGRKLVITAHYDNSVRNKYNPAPSQEVIWADQSWEEMFVPFVMYSVESKGAKPSTQEQQP